MTTVIAQPPPVAPVTAAKPAVQQHTPAPSLDKTQILEEKVAEILNKIKIFESDLSSTGIWEANYNIADVDFDTWNFFYANYTESLGFKFQYMYPEKIIIVTRPSGTHETLQALLKPVADLVAAANVYIADSSQRFKVSTNHAIPLSSKSTVTPDFGFGKRCTNSSVQYQILFECAWSQGTPSLEEKVQRCLQDPEVLAVVCIDIHTPVKYKMPSTAPEPNMVSEFPTDPKRKFLGPVNYLGYTWAQIDQIDLSIHHRGGRVDKFARLNPIDGIRDPILLAMQHKVNNALIRLLGRAMGKSTLEKAVKGLQGRFVPLAWELFYEDLEHSLLADGFNRYRQWMQEFEKAKGLKRKFAADENEEINEDWADGIMGIDKKQKI
ncbi:hypothetical protein B0H14DRAFT_3534576 [Mycena olivaceomarginata]|nr:hypothetical protein B0H14DRAFT_3534576 [Mycena olivaceomarginata]